MTTYLSNHFSLEEMIATQHRGIDNEPPSRIVEVLRDTAERMEAVRELLGQPIHVNSGFRSAALNAAVGGARTSAHMTGRACDFICPGFGSPLKVCRAVEASDITFDQLIYEGTWCHISFDPRMRRQVIRAQGGRYVSGLAA